MAGMPIYVLAYGQNTMGIGDMALWMKWSGVDTPRLL